MRNASTAKIIRRAGLNLVVALSMLAVSGLAAADIVWT